MEYCTRMAQRICMLRLSLSKTEDDITIMGDIMSRKITEAQRAAVGRYEAKTYDKVLLRMPKGEREQIQVCAAAVGESVNGYILQAVRTRMRIDEGKK